MEKIETPSETLAGLSAPKELACLRGWLVWKAELKDGGKKPLKVPYYANGRRRYGQQGTDTDRSQLVTFEEAKEAAKTQNASGIGLAMLEDWGLTCLDFDNCVIDGEIAPEVEAVLAGTYAEFSPSGTGLHAFVKGSLGNQKSHGTPDRPIGFECFQTAGFVTFSGNRTYLVDMLGDCIETPSEQLLALWSQRFTVKAEQTSTETLGLNETQIKDCLAAISPDVGHDDWLKVGMALHHETGGEGFNYWDEWSRDGYTYPGEEALSLRWDSFGEGTGSVVTGRTLLKMAADNGVIVNRSLISEDDFDIIPEPPLPPGGHFKIRSAADFIENVKPISWMIKGFLPKADLGVIYGDSGSGKSFLALDLCAALSMGQDWNGHRVPQKAKVLYVVAEGANGFNLRIRAYCKDRGVDPEALDIDIISDVIPNLMEPGSVSALIREVKDSGYDLIVMDTFAQVMPGADESSSQGMGQAISECKKLGKASGAMVMLVHHSGKDASKGARGWSGLRAAADVELEVTRDGDDRIVEAMKLKDGVDRARFGFTLKSVDLWADEDGDIINSCVVEYCQAAPREDKRKKTERVGYLEADILDYVHQSISMDASQGIKQAHLVDYCVGFLDPPKDDSRDQRQYRVTRAIESLLRKGKIEVDGDGVVSAPDPNL